MTSINPYYTFHYAQPAAYRFSHDSVFLARRAFERTAARVTQATRVLDLCAGCGIVGLDYLWHLRAERGIEPARLDFLELQDEYAASLHENLRRFGATATRFGSLGLNYADFTPLERYDVILCNPPYFRVGTGKLPPSVFKARCRFFVDADWAALEACVTRALEPGGDAFVLAREPGLNVFRSHGDVGRLDDVRGTALWHVRG